MIATVEQRNKFSVGDEIEVFGPNTLLNTFTVTNIVNDRNESVDSASHPQEIIKIKIPFEVHENDILRVKILTN